jgi:PleD family two-component response regulator
LSENLKTIVVVDDDPNVGLLVSVILKNLNYNVVSLTSGGELLDYLSKNLKPSLILLDIKLPDIDGSEICKKIRENNIYSDIPIIILTGISEMDYKVKMIEIGADDYINKPFDVRELKVRINRILRRKDSDSSLNPLTKLPGGPLIEEYVKKLISEGKVFSYAYIDIDNFKAYNDVYGYLKGDGVIRYLARMLVDTVKKYETEICFIGHIGGDDFVIVASRDKIIDIVEEVIRKFDDDIFVFYSDEDKKRGYILTTDRMNNVKKFPFMTLSVSVVNVLKRMHYARIIEKVFEIKRFLKSRSSKDKSVYHIDRRINE